jgi:hypothetical protein
MEDPARILEDRVEDLARELVVTINGADVPGRPNLRGDLRDFAISLLQDSIASSEPAELTRGAETERGFNPIAMGIPLFFAGGVLFFLFPPVGMMLFAASGAMIVWGVMVSLVARR